MYLKNSIYHIVLLEVIVKILECSSKGDKRFSAMYAKVHVFKEINTIERHYQLVKRTSIPGTKTLYISGKGKKVEFVEINKILLPPSYLTPWYKLLWVKYLDGHTDLVEYAKGFDKFNDMFRGRAINCQADVIEQYVKQGRKSIIDECSQLISYLR